MARIRRKFSDEFKQEAVRMVTVWGVSRSCLSAFRTRPTRRLAQVDAAIAAAMRTSFAFSDRK